jgi:glycerol-3-phosphate dehydrogenase subunit C
VGEYLGLLYKEDELDTGFGPLHLRAAYYPPCHLREQKIGKPYKGLLEMIPELFVDTIDGLYCFGTAGIMGFKEEFHHRSIRIGSSLTARIRSLNPDVIATDCLSYRMQFNQMTPFKVMHPIEMIREAYEDSQG